MVHSDLKIEPKRKCCVGIADIPKVTGSCKTEAHYFQAYNRGLEFALNKEVVNGS